MLFRFFVLLFCLTAICAQKGGRQASASEDRPIQRSPSRILSGRKIPQASERIQQVKEPDRDPEEDREVVVAALPRRPAPPPRPQQPEDPGHPAPEPYSFKYSVDDPETGAATSREETQDINGEIVGYYHIQDRDGRMRRVDYTAGKDGFKANIKSNEEGLNARAPADVNIELSASPSELRPSYAPNNRPAASETSIKSYGRPSSERFFQRLIPAAFIPAPAPIAPLPAPAPPTQETQRIEQVVQQREEDPAEEAHISQKYETSEPSDPQEIVQQRNVDIEEAFESAPPTPRPAVKGAATAPESTPIWSPPPQRPTGQFSSSIIQTFREQGFASLQPTPLAQVREEIPNTIQEPQPPASTKTIPSAPIAPPTTYQPLASIVSSPVFPLRRPTPQVQPQFIQYNHRAIPSIRQSVPNLAPLSPPSNNIILQHREHREPISQERLLNYFQPIQVQQPQQWVQPIHGGYNIAIQHRENQVSAPRQPIITQQRVIEEPEPPQERTEYRSESQVQQLVPPPQQQIEYRPLPSLSRSVQREASFEPQTYEPIQQTYEPLEQKHEPLQQVAEDPAEESRAPPPCKCGEESVPAPVKSGWSAPSEPQPVKSGRLSPARARAFIPQAFRAS